MKASRSVLILVVLTALMTGCTWFGGPIDNGIGHVATSGNLLLNPKADNGLMHWSDPEGVFSVQAGSGNPAFASADKGALYQIVDIHDQLGSHAVLVGITASQNLRPYTGVGLVHGYLNDNSTPTNIVGYLNADTSSSQATQSDQWSIVYSIAQIPEDAVSITVFLEALVNPADPPDGTYTWFDDLGLYIADGQAAAQKVVDDYIVDYSWAVTRMSRGE